MDFETSYELEGSFVDISFKIPSEAQELNASFFRFYATYHLLKKDGSDSYEEVPVMKLVGHSSHFDDDFIDAADSISDSTLENYSFAKGLYEQVVETNFHDDLMMKTGLAINRWATLECVYLTDEIKYFDEVVHFQVYEAFLKAFKQTWRQFFRNDITLISFNECLYVSSDEKVQTKVSSAYAGIGFLPTLNKKQLIGNNSYPVGNKTMKLKDLFTFDYNHFFGSHLKNGKIKQYSGFIYQES